MARLSVFGLGYVGAVSAACLAADGHEVVGVDVNPDKVEMIGAGRSPMVEAGLDRVLETVVEEGRLVATMDAVEAVRSTDVSMICVGTPNGRNGQLDLSAVERVVQEIGSAIKAKTEKHVVCVRSTMLPGSTRSIVVPILEEASGRAIGDRIGVAVNPEFLREGSAIDDFYHPSFTLIGQNDDRAGEEIESLYGRIDAPIIRTQLETAEMVKYVSNAFHAMKVAFANEVGVLSKSHGVDGRDVMDIIVRDRELNISPAYLRPGFAYGGSCLPKDTRALAYRARELDLDVPLLNSLNASNDRHVQRAIEAVERTGRRSVAILGLAFKAGTDDIRESPMVPVVETLVGRGYDVKVYDEQVELSRLMGGNRAFVQQAIPHIAALLESDLPKVVAGAEVILLGNSSPEFKSVPTLMTARQYLIDLVGVVDPSDVQQGEYEGLCW